VPVGQSATRKEEWLNLNTLERWDLHIDGITQQTEAGQSKW